MIELLAILLRGKVFPLARPIGDICVGKYLLFIAESCVRHKYTRTYTVRTNCRNSMLNLTLCILTKGL
jgi:hypothetical protein